MIRPLRTIHRRVFAVLGVALPIAFVISIAARKPPAIADSLPSALAVVPNRFTVSVWERDDLFSQNRLGVHLQRESLAADSFAVSLHAPDDFAKPDVMVYWVTGETASPETLPENARLLGTLSAAELILPADFATRAGRLILYSLADQEIVASSRPFSAVPAK